MIHETLRLAREDWAHQTDSLPPVCGLTADHLICLAVGSIHQHNWPTAPLTEEDAAILIGKIDTYPLTKLHYWLSLNT